MRAAISSPERQREVISRRLLRAMGLLVASSLAIVTYARVTDRPLEAMPVDGKIVDERVVHVFADMNGAAKILDVDGSVIADLPPTEGGFIAGVWRAVTFERHKIGVDPDAPVTLMRFEDGRLALRDEAGEGRYELIGFGPGNAAAFARLLNK